MSLERLFPFVPEKTERKINQATKLCNSEAEITKTDLTFKNQANILGCLLIPDWTLFTAFKTFLTPLGKKSRNMLENLQYFDPY